MFGKYYLSIVMGSLGAVVITGIISGPITALFTACFGLGSIVGYLVKGYENEGK